MKRRDIDMLHGPLSRNILMYVIPVILTSYLQLLFNAADLIVVGQYCGSTSVAAVGSSTPLVHLFLNLFTGLSVGAGVSVAHAIGAADPESISRSVHTSMLTSLISGVFITIVGVTFSPAMLRMMFTTLPYFMYGWLDTITGAIRGLGASFVSMLLSILGICGVRLVWILGVFPLPAFHTPFHLYLSYPISWIITIAAQLTAFIIVYRRKTAAYDIQ